MEERLKFIARLLDGEKMAAALCREWNTNCKCSVQSQKALYEAFYRAG